MLQPLSLKYGKWTVDLRLGTMESELRLMDYLKDVRGKIF